MPSLSTTLDRVESLSTGQASVPYSPRATTVDLRCPFCSTDNFGFLYSSLAQEQTPIACRGCSSVLFQERGIWNALPPDRQRYFSRFIKDYEYVRSAEGRGSSDAEFYWALPYTDVTGRNSWQWSIRCRTYAYLENRILPHLSRGANQPLAILDLGAGNGWLSYRLARLGHRPIAVDLLTNELDGLGAAAHYQVALPEFFPRFRAELDRLPFAGGQFDCAIFNASFHYSENYKRTLAEAIRCLCPGGTIIIADSPSYVREVSGQQMKKEREELFQKRFGFRSDGLMSGEYLTKERLIALEAQHDLLWQTHHVWHGLRWACRPLLAKWGNRREPSQFRIYTARVKVS